MTNPPPYGPQDSGRPGGFPSYGGSEPTLQLPRTAFGAPPAAPGPTPPKKDNTLQLLGIIAGVVTVLAIIGITAFVTPGFLVSHDDDAGSTPSVQTAPPTEEPTDLPTDLPTRLPTELPSLPTELPSALPTGPATGGPVVTAPTGKAAITAFLASVNAGNVKAALSRSCVSSRDLLQSTVTEAVQHHAKLRATGLDDNSLLVMGQLSGTVDGHPVTGAVTATNFDQRGFCVSTFLAM